MLSDLHKAFAPRLLAGADELRRAAYWLYDKADDLHYYLEKWERTLTGEPGWPE